MAKVNRTLMIGDDVVEIASDNLPNAAANAKGAVKRGTSVLCRPMQNSETIDEDYSFNEQVRSLRASGALQNDKFALVFDLNGSGADFEHLGDLQRPHEYTTGQTVTLDLSDTQNIPTRDGYNFIGFALTENAVTPDYPYDENDPQTYTLTFVDNDIVLYAVWEEPHYTVTYSLGEYGQGSVPAAQTVPEGESVNVSFSPAPTVNDGSGRVFVGWATEDGYSIYNAAQYRQNGTTSFTPYADVTLYPVFCAQYTLTYALGNDGTGSVPVGGTYYDGENAYLSFSPAPTCVSDPSKSFLGWATSDEQSSATYPTGGMMNFINMQSNVTLYPAFGTEGNYTLTYVLGDYATGSVPAPATGTVGMMGMVTYNLSYSPEPTCTRAGEWKFSGWSTTDGAAYPTYIKGMQSTATVSGNLTLYPVFSEVVHTGMYIDNDTDDDVLVQQYDGKSDTWQTVLTVASGATIRFENYLSQTNYRISAESSSTVIASYDGDYNGVNYKSQSVTVQAGVVYDPAGTQYWNYTNTPDGTLTIENSVQ